MKVTLSIEMERPTCNMCPLASRICDLKTAGYQIKREMIKVRKRGGAIAHVARYSWEVAA